ncbi:MAG: PilZ domain-containing protein [Oligoflexales bacterium]
MPETQRQFPRYEVRLPVRIEPTNGDSFEPQSFESINISLGGILIRGNRKKHGFLAEPTVKVLLTLPAPHGSVSFLASPIRMGVDGSIGLSIVQIDAGDENRYKNFAKTCSATKA